MIMTLRMLIRTMAMSISLMKKVIRSIILAMLAKGESCDQVWTSMPPPFCFFSPKPSPAPYALSDFFHLRQGFYPDCDLAHLFAGHPQDFSGVIEIDVTVSTTRTGCAFQNAAHEKCLAVDRSIFVGRDHHDGVADFGAKPLGQQFRHQDFSLVQRADTFFPFR